MLKPFTLEFQPLLEEVLRWEKEVKECADIATMQRILGLYSYIRPEGVTASKEIHELMQWCVYSKLTGSPRDAPTSE